MFLGIPPALLQSPGEYRVPHTLACTHNGRERERERRRKKGESEVCNGVQEVKVFGLPVQG